jgi:hypothetical protein
LKNFDKSPRGQPGFPLISRIKGRLPATGLPGRTCQADTQFAKYPYHGLSDFRKNSIHQALDEQGHGLVRIHFLMVAPAGYWLLVAGRWYLALGGGKKKTAKDYNEPFKKSSVKK